MWGVAVEVTEVAQVLFEGGVARFVRAAVAVEPGHVQPGFGRLVVGPAAQPYLVAEGDHDPVAVGGALGCRRGLAVDDERHLAAHHYPLDLVTRGHPQIRRQEVVHHRSPHLGGVGAGGRVPVPVTSSCWSSRRAAAIFRRVHVASDGA